MKHDKTNPAADYAERLGEVAEKEVRELAKRMYVADLCVPDSTGDLKGTLPWAIKAARYFVEHYDEADE